MNKKTAFWIITFAIIACIIVGICFITNTKNDKETTTEETSVTDIDATEEKEELTPDNEPLFYSPSNITYTWNTVCDVDDLTKVNALGYTDWDVGIVPNTDFSVDELFYELVVFRDGGQMVLGTWFGFDDDSIPTLYLVDIDGDGNNEMICNCHYEDDGAGRVFIYRNNNGTIEQGTISEEFYLEALGLSDADSLPQPNEIEETFDYYTNEISIYVQDDLAFVIAPDDESIEYTEYVYHSNPNVTEIPMGPEKITGSCSVLGYENYTFETVRCLEGNPDITKSYYEIQIVRTGGQMVLGTWFGVIDYRNPIPDIYLADFDYDDTAELISNCEYENGIKRVFIYRNNNGTIEQGVISEDYYLAALGLSDADSLPQPDAIQEMYDPENNVIRITIEGDREFEITFADIRNIVFSEYEY